jgi:hypothetical protein
MPFVSFGLVLVTSFLALPFLLDDVWVTRKSGLDVAEASSQEMACLHEELYWAHDVYGGT